jgi:hypothetical protein
MKLKQLTLFDWLEYRPELLIPGVVRYHPDSRYSVVYIIF